MYPTSGPTGVAVGSSKGSSALPAFSGIHLSRKVSDKLIDLASQGDPRGVCSLVSQHRVDLDAQLDCEEWNPLQFFVAEGKFNLFLSYPLL